MASGNNKKLAKVEKRKIAVILKIDHNIVRLRPGNESSCNG